MPLSFFIAVPMTLSLAHIAILAAVVVLLFGGARLASLGKGLGEGIRNFKQGLKGEEDAEKTALKKADDAEKK